MTGPSHVNIRTYQVGFGDCFLLSFAYPGSVPAERHMLVDFGSTGLPKAAPSSRMADVAADIRERTGGKLTVVVATHRHKDHISGFATQPDRTGTGDVIAALKPELVIQPWTEDPELAKEAEGPDEGLQPPGRQVRALMRMHATAEGILAEAAGARRLDARVDEELSFIGDDNLANKSAVVNLMTMAKNRYVYFGADAGLDELLPGVNVDVLGPPTVKQSAAIKRQRSSDPDEFWQLQANALDLATPARLAGGSLFPGYEVKGPPWPIDARWLIYHAQATRGDQLLQIVRSLDDAMNNTSVILLFEIGDKLLLFPGDAQIENWSYALGKDEVCARLAQVNLYKVGHHGSRNATPRTLWGLFKNKDKVDKAQRLIALMSTMAGKHGKTEATAVPRATLVEELKTHADLFTTQDLAGADFFHDTVVSFI